MNPKLYRAASSGDLSLFETLPNSDTLFDVTTEKSTVLHVAVQCNYPRVAQKIVELCPSLIYQTNSKGNTPLHVAARVGSHSMVNLLIESTKRSNVEIGGRKILRMVNLVKDTALHVAVQYGKFRAVEELITEDPELGTFINNAGESALFLAVDRQFYNIASCILNAAPECSFAGRDGMNVLHAMAIRSSHVEIIDRDMFLSKGRGVRFLRALLGPLNVYLPPAWVLFNHEFRPTHDQCKSKTIREGFLLLPLTLLKANHSHRQPRLDQRRFSHHDPSSTMRQPKQTHARVHSSKNCKHVPPRISPKNYCKHSYAVDVVLEFLHMRRSTRTHPQTLIPASMP